MEYLRNIQSNLGYPNVGYPKLLGYSKTTHSPDFFYFQTIVKSWAIYFPYPIMDCVSMH